MAYSTSDLMVLLTPAAIGGDGPRLFYHESADALAAVNTSGFITDALEKGLRVGDYVLHKDTTTANGNTSLHEVLSLSSSAADLSDGTVVCDGTDSD